MGVGVLVCGLNGCGKSTLGKALAERLGAAFIDNEDLYFPKTDPGYLYAVQRTQREAEELFWREINRHDRLVFAAVRSDHGERVYPFFKCAVLLDVPREERLRRVMERSFVKFGARMRPGGDLCEAEERFFRFVAARPEDHVEKWLTALECPVFRVDGTRPVNENVEKLCKVIVL